MEGIASAEAAPTSEAIEMGGDETMNPFSYAPSASRLSELPVATAQSEKELVRKATTTSWFEDEFQEELSSAKKKGQGQRQSKGQCWHGFQG